MDTNAKLINGVFHLSEGLIHCTKNGRWVAIRHDGLSFKQCRSKDEAIRYLVHYWN